VPAGATRDLTKTQDADPLSLWEKARVRGDETWPTKSAGRILEAQLDQLPDSELTINLKPKACR
jgi:hypothetical protein